MNEKICCVLGGPQQDLKKKADKKNYSYLKERLKKEIETAISEDYNTFITSCTSDIELFAIELVIELRKEANWIKIEVAAPLVNKANTLILNQHENFYILLARADNVFYFDSLEISESILKSYKYMIEKSSRIIAVTDGRPGAIISALRYAVFNEIGIKIIHPLSKDADHDIFFQKTLIMLLKKMNENK